MSMNDLATYAMDAHGGLERWNKLKRVTAHLLNGGGLWALKGKDGVLKDVHVTVELRNEKASHWPFVNSNWRTSFQPNRMAIETNDGNVVEELLKPRDSFKGHVLETKWNNLQLGYFAGYAMWTYFSTPFLFALPGVHTEEIEPWQENGETWRRLKVRFPRDIATHSTEQTFYFDQKGLLKRHDYDVEISAASPGAHYVSELRECSGIMVPTKRRVFVRQPDGRPDKTTLTVSIDLNNITFS